MPQLARTRRTGWAALAVVALVASLVTVGSTPIGAVKNKADNAVSYNAACGGNAADDAEFTDVSSSHSHRDAINCLAHYRVTLGTSPGVYSPNDDVTRYQMALFMKRAVNVAGVTLAAPADQGFTDIGDFSAGIQDAINQMAAAGIVTGANNMFRPGDSVTRGEMALILKGFLQSVGTLRYTTTTPPQLQIRPAGSTYQAFNPDDVFEDVRNTQPRAVDEAVSILFEMGVANGTKAATRTSPAEFSPGRTVNRGQMASFITRALAHTGARPAGISIAPGGGSTYVVSLRDSNFAPVRNQRVDTFWIKGDTSEVFKSDGTCEPGIVSATVSACSITDNDPVTNNNGQLSFTTDGASPDATESVTIWAWIGNVGATVNSGTSFAKYVDTAPPVSALAAAKYTIKRGSETDTARLGSLVEVTLQITDANDGNVAQAGYKFDVTVTSSPFSRRVTIITDENGQAKFQVGGQQDYAIDTSEDDTAVTVSWVATRNTAGEPEGLVASLTLADGSHPSVSFSDDAPVLTTVRATSEAPYIRADTSGAGASHAIMVAAFDQYGVPQSNVAVTVAATGDTTVSGSLPPTARYTGNDGTVPIRYQRDSADPATVMYTATGTAGATSVDSTAALTVYWVTTPPSAFADATSGTELVLAANADRNEIVVTSSTPSASDQSEAGPWVFVYDASDRFDSALNLQFPTGSTCTVGCLAGAGATSLEVFEKAIAAKLANNAKAAAAGSGTETFLLTWSNRHGVRNTIVSWSVDEGTG